MATDTLPAGPRGHFLLGNLPAIQRDPLHNMTEWAQRYGDFVPIRFGLYRGFFINHPDYIEQVLVANARHYVKAPPCGRAASCSATGC